MCISWAYEYALYRRCGWANCLETALCITSPSRYLAYVVVSTQGTKFRVAAAEPSHNASALAAHMAGDILSNPKESALAPQGAWAPPAAFDFDSGSSEDELFEAAEDEGVFLSR